MSKMKLVNGKYILVSETFQEFIKDKKFTNTKTNNKVKFGSLPKKTQVEIKKKWEHDSRKENAIKKQKQGPTVKHVDKSGAAQGLENDIRRKYGLGKIPPAIKEILNLEDGITQQTDPNLFTGTAKYSTRTYKDPETKEVVPYSKLPQKMQRDIALNNQGKSESQRLMAPIPAVGTENKNKAGKVTMKVDSIEYNPGFNPKYPADSGKYCVVHKTTWDNKKQDYKQITETIYPLAQVQKSNRLTFLVMQQAAKNWTNFQSKIDKDLKTLKPGTKEFASAVAYAIQYETAARIGNPKNTKHGVFGASTLQKRHVKFNPDGTATLRYTGKDKVKHTKVVKNPTLVNALKKMDQRASNPEESLFTYDKPITKKDINKVGQDYINKVTKKFNFVNANGARDFMIQLQAVKSPQDFDKLYEDWEFEGDGWKKEDVKKLTDQIDKKLKRAGVNAGKFAIRNEHVVTEYIKGRLKAPMGSHTVRHVHANKTFAIASSKINPKDYPFEGERGVPSKAYKSKVQKLFRASVERAASVLGNNYSACISNYIDPAMTVKFFSGFGIKPQFYPDALKKIMMQAAILYAKDIETDSWDFKNWDANQNGMRDFSILIDSFDWDKTPSVPQKFTNKEKLLNMAGDK